MSELSAKKQEEVTLLKLLDLNCFYLLLDILYITSIIYFCLYLIHLAKQKHLGCKKVRGQSEATLQTGRRDQKV